MCIKLFDRMDYYIHWKAKKALHDYKWDDENCGDPNCPFCK
jgi:hypothetical protein